MKARTNKDKVSDVLVWIVGFMLVGLLIALLSLLGTSVLYLVYNLLIRRAFPLMPYASFLQVWCVCFVLGVIGNAFKSGGKGE